MTLEIAIRNLGFDHPIITEKKVYEGADLDGPIAGKDTGIETGALESVGDFGFEAHWYNRRRIKGNDRYSASEIKDFHRQWTGIRLYRDGFRVYPYGSEEDDWLGLDRRALMAKGMVVQVLENLISNSVYWLDLEKKQSAEFSPEIKISLDDLTNTIYFEDNGPGIHPANAEDIFDMFFSLKETRKRRGLGLYIARQCAAFNGGALELDTEVENESGR